MEKKKWVPAIILGMMFAWFIREPATLFVLSGRTYSGRSLVVQLFILILFGSIISASLFFIFPKPMKWLAEQYEKFKPPDLISTYPSSTLTPVSRIDIFISVFLGFAAFVLYVRTLAPDLQYADSGEFQTVVYTLGTTHPTGYQVYVLLGRLFTLLPIGGLAYRVNLFSAFLGSLTVSMMYLIVRILTARRLAAVTAALAMGVFPLFWYYAIFAESYVPSSAFISGVILTVFLWRLSGKWQWLAASGLLGGVSLGVHVSVALIAPGILFYLLACMKGIQRERPWWRIQDHWRGAIAGLLIGLALTAGAFLALDANDAKADYFHAVVEPNLSVFRLDKEDIDSPFERFVFQFTARQFQRAMFDNPALVWPVRLEIFSNMANSFFLPSTIALILIGLISLTFQKWREGMFLIIGWTVTFFFMMNYNIMVPDVLVFFFPVILFAWLGAGIATLMQIVAKILYRTISNREAVIASTLIGFILFGWMINNHLDSIQEAWRERMVTFMVGNQFSVYSYPLRNPGEVREEAMNLVDAVEDDAVVFLGWRLLFPAYFVSHVEGKSPDTMFHESIQRIKGQPDIYPSTAEYIRGLVTNRPVYYYGECPRGPLIDQFDVKQQSRNGVELCKVLGLRN